MLSIYTKWNNNSMAVPGRKRPWEQAAEVFFYLLVFASIACFALLQTYGDPPDEINRFKIVAFIMNHGRLPHGADPEVIIAGYGASYAFQPILTYILQGFLLRFMKLFTSDGYLLLLTARMVNVFFGVLMAYFVRKISVEMWKNPYLQWVFTLLVVFLPQNLFIHSYVNTDSMAMLSVAMIVYALLLAQRTDYRVSDAVLLAAGIILCAMSYYNAYGIILAAVILFVFHYLQWEKKGDKHSLNIRWRSMFLRGALVSGIVLAGIGWWFIRNAVLYQGDMIAMEARRLCAIETASPDYNPLTRFTYAKALVPLSQMLFQTGYVTLLRDSFIAMFGPMIIPTHGLIYIYYKRFWILSCLAAILPVKTKKSRQLSREKESDWLEERDVKRKDMAAFWACMTLFAAITVGLSVYYSYTWEFQPQGRYILPILIPFMLLSVTGLQKICILLERLGAWELWKSSKDKMHKLGILAGKLLCLGVCAYVMLAFAYSLFNRFIPYYLEGENMLSMYGKAFVW